MDMKLLRTCTMLLGLSALSASCSTSEALSLDRELLIANDARAVEERQLGDNHLQITYEVSREFPDLAIGEPEWKKLEQAGWARCEDRIPGWETHDDYAGATPYSVHQYMTHWAKSDELLTVILRYESKLLSEQSNNRKPDSNAQMVVVLLDRLDNPREAESLFNVSCPQ